MNILNQYKIVKFIEKHIVTIKKAIKIWKNSRLRHNKKILDISASNEINIENLYCEVCVSYGFYPLFVSQKQFFFLILE